MSWRIIGVAVFALLAAAGLFWLSVMLSSSTSQMQSEPVANAPTKLGANQKATRRAEMESTDPVAQLARVVAMPAPPNTTSSEMPEYTPDQALAMMQHRVEHGESRQPALAKKKPSTTAPTAEELSSPLKYAAYEAGQNRSLISVYASVLQQLPALRERVNRGAHDPTISAADYQQAVEALEQLEMMRARLAIEQPQLLSHTTAP